MQKLGDHWRKVQFISEGPWRTRLHDLYANRHLEINVSRINKAQYKSKRYRLERISSSGEVRQNAIEKLMARGINNREEKDIELCYSVAHKIWEAITKSLDSYFLQYTPSPPTQMVSSPICEYEETDLGG